MAIPFRKEISCITRDNFALFRLNLVQKKIYIRGNRKKVKGQYLDYFKSYLYNCMILLVVQ